VVGKIICLESWIECYGQLTVVSNVDGEGFVLNVDGRKVQDLDYIEARMSRLRREVLVSVVMTTRARK
jgi:hypothetical protein